MNNKDGLVEGNKDGLVEGNKDGLVEGNKDGLVEGCRCVVWCVKAFHKHRLLPLCGYRKCSDHDVNHNCVNPSVVLNNVYVVLHCCWFDNCNSRLCVHIINRCVYYWYMNPNRILNIVCMKLWLWWCVVMLKQGWIIVRKWLLMCCCCCKVAVAEEKIQKVATGMR